MFYIRAKAPISIIMEVGVFCLLRLRPNPRRIQFCILETLRKCSGCAIFQIAYGRLTSFFFGFSLHGMRILPQNPVHICLGSLQRTHLLSGLLIVCIHGFFLGQKLSVFRLQALDGGQLFQILLTIFFFNTSSIFYFCVSFSLKSDDWRQFIPTLGGIIP